MSHFHSLFVCVFLLSLRCQICQKVCLKNTDLPHIQAISMPTSNNHTFLMSITKL